MDIEKTTQVLEGISLGLMRIIEIFAPIMFIIRIDEDY